MIKLNRSILDSLPIYGEAHLEACRQAGVADPVKALTDTDEYPRLLKIPQAEWNVGWFAGVAEAHGVLVEVLWEQAVAAIAKQAAPVARKTRRAS